ncbi:MFS transporter [Aquibacillus koreensis]|uniref:MFS transporter n=1 Tax=Aquibacillus koreensis TaxID=279446 RepID=A0A9X3WR69_9BACI|nr:MFS transporter [Aquibacillus koreensis]MCT2534915.1 MFS transporter [Aquibacillus koreensis]MDC3422191.1 MFS transporter [Aquibacillus koreensis]
MKKNHFAIVGSFFLGEFARSMYFVVITWMLYQMTEDALYTGLMVSLGFIPGVILNLFIGVIVDRINRKVLSILSILINTITMFALFSIMLVDLLEAWMILIVHMIIQLMGSVFRPSIQALTAEVFNKRDLPKIFSQSSASGITGSLIGASIGGIIIGVATASVALLIITISYAASFLLLAKISYKPVARSQVKHSIGHDLKEGFAYLRMHPFLFRLFGIMFTGQLVFHTSIGFLSVYTIEFLNQTAFVYGMLDASLSVGGVVAGIFGTWWLKVNQNRLAANALVIIFIGLLALGLAPIALVSFIGVFLVGLGTTWIRVLLQSIQQIATAKAYHGRMASYRMLCNQGSVVISGPIVGIIASNFGAEAVYLSLLLPVIIACGLSLTHTYKLQFNKTMEISG